MTHCLHYFFITIIIIFLLKKKIVSTINNNDNNNKENQFTKLEQTCSSSKQAKDRQKLGKDSTNKKKKNVNARQTCMLLLLATIFSVFFYYIHIHTLTVHCFDCPNWLENRIKGIYDVNSNCVSEIKKNLVKLFETHSFSMFFLFSYHELFCLLK